MFSLCLVGYGWSAKGDVAYSHELWGAQVADFVREVVGEPAVLCGNSLGGIAALRAAALHPPLVAGLALLNTAGDFAPGARGRDGASLGAGARGAAPRRREHAAGTGVGASNSWWRIGRVALTVLGAVPGDMAAPAGASPRSRLLSRTRTLRRGLGRGVGAARRLLAPPRRWIAGALLHATRAGAQGILGNVYVNARQVSPWPT